MNFSKKVIKNILEYSYLQRKENCINIAYGIDDNYVRCAGTSIASICFNNKNKNFCFHIIGADLSKESKEKLLKLAVSLNSDIFIYEIDKSFFFNLPSVHISSIATYFRILLPDILKKKKIKYLYYIDADIVCLKDISSLLKINLENNIIAATPDSLKMNKKRNKSLNLLEHIYFNAGVLIIDINKWNENEISKKVVETINKYKDIIKYEDQDALNIVLSGKVKYISNKFNCMNPNRENFSDIVLLHFANAPKPWNKYWNLNVINNTFTKSIYDNYEKLTPWKICGKEEYSSYKKIVKWYIKYILHKFRIL